MNKLDLDLFYQELDIRCEQWGLTWAQVQAQSRVSSTTRILIDGTGNGTERQRYDKIESVAAKLAVAAELIWIAGDRIGLPRKIFT